jgi:hypothetical protein
MGKMNSEIPPFYIGQKIILIGGDGKWLKNGGIYTCHENIQCKCGQWYTSVKESVVDGLKASCVKCNSVLSEKYNHAGRTSEQFASEMAFFQSISLSEVLEKETSLIGSN